MNGQRTRLKTSKNLKHPTITREMRRYPVPNYRMVIDGKWRMMKEKELLDLEKTDKAEYDRLDEIILNHQVCPISDFMPHGVKSKTGNDGLDCLNDWKNDLILMLAPNQVGKTTLGAAYSILHGLVPTDPEWPIFKKHGVEYHEWEGPKILIAGSYSWDNVTTLWETYRNLLPRSEMLQYSPYWGNFPGENGKAMHMTTAFGATKMIDLACGSKMIFLCYTQRGEHWEGKQCDIAHLDEQCPEDKFDGLTARQLTRGDYTPIIMTLTGHILPDRPDTGAAGWIKNKLIDQDQMRGRKFKTYHMSVKSTPDVIMDKKQKDRSYVQWVYEPEKNNDLKKINEGKARYWGDWQVGGGVVFDEVVPDIHFVEPFNPFLYRPMWMRMIDHGQNPCAALLFAKFPWGDTVVVNEYYIWNRSIAEHAVGIVRELCENDVSVVDEYMEGDQLVKVYNEKFLKRIIAISELDSRSYGTKSMGNNSKNLGMMYNEAGLSCKPADGKHDRIVYPMVKELFSLDKKRPHLYTKIGREPTPDMMKYGSPQLYIFSTCKNLITELKQYTQKHLPSAQSNTGAIARYVGKDHLISCLKFLAARQRPYIGESSEMYDDVQEEPCERRGFSV